MIKQECWVCMKLKPWKCGEMVFIIGERIEILVKYKKRYSRQYFYDKNISQYDQESRLNYVKV